MSETTKLTQLGAGRRSLFKAGAAAAFVATLSACAPAMTQPDVVDILASNDQFSTLVAAVGAAELAETLKGDGPFTVFAPTNAAFAALPAGTVESLLLPENKDTLVSILTYHVVPGAVTSDQLLGQRLDVETVQGQSVHIDATNGVRVNRANVTQADIIGSNGVIHRIDSVLLPK
ncbi:MAG: fasciclin domain-containing protein [Paracoccaceae bacterium]|uniref:fasciclin domain-containing protein n=1 Tax=Seohaeicola saemankumensis TaxID=481181 RepID=UPI003AF34FE9|nr:fasciclin domain-containing protein [Seohaeicola saemankumensis]